MLLNELKKISNLRFDSLEEYLDYYREMLPQRCPDGIQEEIGPVFQQKTKDVAKEYLHRHFYFDGNGLNMSSNLDWYAAPNGDYEWTCTFARHHHLTILADAFKKTREEKYAREAMNQMLHWIEHIKRPKHLQNMEYLDIKKSNWRALEVAFRIGETWPTALKVLLKSKCMSPEKWGKILLSLYNQADYLNLYRGKVGNHAIMEASALAIFSILFREFKKTKQWLKECLKFLTDSRSREFFADGYSREMSGGYRWTMVKGYFTLYQVSRHNKLPGLFSEGFKKWLIKICKAELLQLKPDFSVPVTNESNSRTKRRYQLNKILKVFPDPDITYFVSRGKKGNLPNFTSYYYRNARIGVMRSDWSKNALYMSVDFGRIGNAHRIGDQLSVDVNAYGRAFLSNCGRWRYTTSPNSSWMRWAEYFKSSLSCNTVIPEGFTQKLADAKGFMEITPSRDRVDAMFSAGYVKGTQALKIIHHRQIFFAKPHFWIIRDILSGKGKHKMEQIWHFLPGNVSINQSKLSVTTKYNNANIIIKAIPDNKTEINLYKGSTSPMRGWHCPQYAKKVPAPEVVFVKNDILPIVFDTLIFPVKGKIKTIPKFERNSHGYYVYYRKREWEIWMKDEN